MLDKGLNFKIHFASMSLVDRWPAASVNLNLRPFLPWFLEAAICSFCVIMIFSKRTKTFPLNQTCYVSILWE